MALFTIDLDSTICETYGLAASDWSERRTTTSVGSVMTVRADDIHGGRAARRQAAARRRHGASPDDCSTRTTPVIAQARPDPSQLALVNYSYHAFISDRAGELLLEADHRRHAEIENGIRG